MKKYATLLLLAIATLLSCSKDEEATRTIDQQIVGTWKVQSHSEVIIDGPDKELIEGVKKDYDVSETPIELLALQRTTFNSDKTCSQTYASFDEKPFTLDGNYTLSNGRIEYVFIDRTNPNPLFIETVVYNFQLTAKGENILFTADKESLIAKYKNELKAKDLGKDEIEGINDEIKKIEVGITKFSTTMELTRVK
jgi:hypothetical protein